MAYKRKYATAAELSAALSQAARSRKVLTTAGRKRVYPDTPEYRKTTVSVRSGDSALLFSLATADCLSMAEEFHKLVTEEKTRRGL